MNIYDFEVRDKNGNLVSMSSYQGKVLLIVNTATECGYTPQYEGLQLLYNQYKDQDFVVLDFPCNQFGKQAPGSMEEIHEFCQLKYKTTFPLFQKIDVNGKNADPLFKFLKDQKKSLLGKTIKWNFTKFLVDKDGNVVNRYESTVTPAQMEQDIVEHLN